MIAFGSAATFSFDLDVAASLAPETIEVPAEGHALDRAPLDAEAITRSVVAIGRALDEEPIEDGITHRAEHLVSAHVGKFGHAGFFDALRSSSLPARAAAFLRLLGRSPGLSASLRQELVSWGLASASVDIRDAAVQAVENWADPALARLLRERHGEPVGWLHDYAANVVRDLEA